ncbi:MAG: amidophosphoribosyltransferase [archaeon]|jgi:amidophosphoribosyltransferase
MDEKCGICGLVVEKNAQVLLYKMLVQMQHRGQLSAGITTYHENERVILRTHKDLGLVNHVFRAEHKGKFTAIMENHASKIGIGHVRYATSGCDDKGYAQPFERTHGKKSKWFSFCFNGNIANYAELESELKESNYHLVHETDTEIIQHLLAKALKDSENIPEAFNNISKKLDGSYNIAFLTAEGTLVAARDPLGLRPLVYSIRGNEVAFASEGVALTSIGFTEYTDLPPGHMLIHEKGKTRIEKFAESQRKAHCFFEYVYFAHPASVIESKLVYTARNNLGKELARIETQKIDSNCIVVPVPDSSTPSGDGYAQTLNIPLREGLIRNRYVGRTFIESASREDKVKEKFIVIKEIIEGKKIFIVEDSIVRGTTLKNLVEYIRRIGKPKEIHVRVSCPPIRFPCFYGIDMSSKKELIAAQEEDYDKMIKLIEKELGVDSLIYQSYDGLIKAIGLNEKDLCTACLKGIYPTPAGTKLKDFDGKGRACAR